MLDSAIFGTYCVGISAIFYNLTRIKKQNEYEEHIKGLREFDLSTDKLRPEHLQNSDQDILVLCKYDNEPQSSEPLMTEQIPYANVLDTTRYFQVSDSHHPNTLLIEQEAQLELRSKRRVSRLPDYGLIAARHQSDLLRPG